VAGYICFAAALLFKWMNRRGHRRSLTWSCFGAVIRPGLPNAGIVHGLYAVPLWNVQAGSRIL
jgi:hypothetical protein